LPGIDPIAAQILALQTSNEVHMEKSNGAVTRVDSSNAVTPVNGSKLVTGVFRDRPSAERAYNVVTGRGYATNDVNVVMSDATRKQHFASTGTETELGNRASEGAGVGGVIGAGIGAVAAAIAAIGTSVIVPGLGLIIAGPLAVTLAGIGAGGLTGGLVGALIGWGMPEERLKYYQEAVEGGGILMGVVPRNVVDATYFESAWKDNRGEYVYR
jgi:hypothetical protein